MQGKYNLADFCAEVSRLLRMEVGRVFQESSGRVQRGQHNDRRTVWAEVHALSCHFG